MASLPHEPPPSAYPGPLEKLEMLMNQPDNRFCADCGSPDPKWVSLNIGVFICIKCSGIHRSLGVHISKVLSIKLDEWTEEQVDTLIDSGGNVAVNMRYEAFMPKNIKKPTPDSSIEERSDFIRQKYELQQFFSSNSSTPGRKINLQEKRSPEKHPTSIRQGLSQAFRNSWRRNEKKSTKSSTSIGMVEFLGLVKVNIVRGINLAIRDVMSSDPYVVLTLGHQTMKTKVIKNSLNPVWNESLMLSIPDSIPPLKLEVYDKDKFSADDKMGEAEIDIRPLVWAAKGHESGASSSGGGERQQLGRCVAAEDNALCKDSMIWLVDGQVRQEMMIRLRNVESGELEIKLECVPLTQ